MNASFRLGHLGSMGLRTSSTASQPDSAASALGPMEPAQTAASQPRGTLLGRWLRKVAVGTPLLLGLSLSLSLVGCGPELTGADSLDDDGAQWGTPSAQSIPTGYYTDAAGKTNTALISALSAIVARNHKSFSYDAARDQMFATVEDPDNDDVVDCIYTGRKASSVSNRSSAYSGAQMNTEHTWPQSLGATGIAQADLHHLWAVDINTNSRRGNYPFGVVATTTWTAPNSDGTGSSKLGKDASGRMVFEPHDRSKGDIARAIFYFYTRYNGSRPGSYTLSNFNAEEATLRRWHQVDPPDADEKTHNELVFSIQGNRNPYIDHPEYIGQISDFP